MTKKSYIYVQALQEGDDVSFRHVAIEAEDDDDAYVIGGRVMDGKPTLGIPLNDYVIAL